jgi:hypothetical protein
MDALNIVTWLNHTLTVAPEFARDLVLTPLLPPDDAEAKALGTHLITHDGGEVTVLSVINSILRTNQTRVAAVFTADGTLTRFRESD